MLRHSLLLVATIAACAGRAPPDDAAILIGEGEGEGEGEDEPRCGGFTLPHEPPPIPAAPTTACVQPAVACAPTYAWTEIPIEGDSFFTSLTVDPRMPQRLYIGDSARTLRRIDGCGAPTDVATDVHTGPSLAARAGDLLVVGAGGVDRATCGEATTPLLQTGFPLSLASFVRQFGADLFVGRRFTGVARLRDGVWRAMPSIAGPYTTAMVSNDDELVALAITGVFRSSDGDTFARQEGGGVNARAATLSGAQGYAVDFLSGDLITTRDAFVTVERREAPFVEDFIALAIDAADPARVYAVTNSGAVVVTNDAFDSVEPTRASAQFSASDPDVRCLAAHPLLPGVAAAAASDTVWRTGDGGVTWVASAFVGGCTELAYTDEGALVVMREDETVFDLDRGAPLTDCAGGFALHTAGFDVVAASPSGPVTVTATEPRGAIGNVVEVGDRVVVGGLRATSWSADGAFVALTEADDVARVFPAQGAALVMKNVDRTLHRTTDGETLSLVRSGVQHVVGSVLTASVWAIVEDDVLHSMNGGASFHVTPHVVGTSSEGGGVTSLLAVDEATGDLFIVDHVALGVTGLRRTIARIDAETDARVVVEDVETESENITSIAVDSASELIYAVMAGTPAGPFVAYRTFTP